MLHFIYGRTGSGKSAYIYSLAQNAAKSRRVILLVPEREAVTAESDCAGLSGAGNIDVVTFSRLCNFIFRSRGGLCENYIGAGAKKILMYETLHELSPELKIYSAIAKNDTATVEKLLAARSELFRNMTDIEKLARISEKSPGLRLAEKFGDLALIFSAYDAKVAEKWRDPEGMIARAADVCGDYFDGTDVFVDSFFTFTREQYEMLSVIFSTAHEVYVTLGYLPKLDRDRVAFTSLSETDRRLHSVAAKRGCTLARDVTLERCVRYGSDEIAFLAENMFSQTGVAAKYMKTPEHIRVMSCGGAYDEADAVAADICRRIQSGERYRDIAVIMRETSDYEGIIDAALKKYGIPYFVSHRAEIDEKPLIKFIFSAYAMIMRGYATEDIINYIKTDYAGITRRDADELENYITKWHISGKRFSGEDPWVQNPRGYEARMRDGDDELLARLGEAREKVRRPLLDFDGKVGACHTVRDYAKELYVFLVTVNVPEKIKQDTEKIKSAGDTLGAQELVQLWRAFCLCLDQIVASVGDERVDAETFLLFLRLALSETDIGAIPTSVDEVLVGGAAKVRPLSAKTVYIIGASEGIFPKTVSGDGIFSDEEKELLFGDGESVSELKKALADEMYYFYLIACSPSENLFITYPRSASSDQAKGKSSALKRIETLFPELKEEKFEDLGAKELIYGKETAMEYAYSCDDELARAIRRAAEDCGEDYHTCSVTAEDDRLSEDDAGTLFGDRLGTSYSRLEEYVKCHFAYFCKYELDIADNVRADFSAANVGSFLHAVLEATAKYAVSPGFSEKKLDEIINSEAGKYILSVTGKPVCDASGRLKHIFDALCASSKKFAVRIRDEFAESKFKPMGFELSVGGDGVAPMKIDDGKTSVDIYGRIDRVDGYEDDDGTLYLRVIDYKKSGKTFDIEKVSDGLGLQMLLYLFSLWENGEKVYNRKIAPAGVIYSEINPKTEKIGDKDKPFSGVITAKGEDGLDLVRAMEPSLEGKYVKITPKTRGKEKKLIGLDAMEQLKDEVRDVVLGCAAELKAGYAGANPLIQNDNNPCKYCKMKHICKIPRRNAEDEDT